MSRRVARAVAKALTTTQPVVDKKCTSNGRCNLLNGRIALANQIIKYYAALLLYASRI